MREAMAQPLSRGPGGRSRERFADDGRRQARWRVDAPVSVSLSVRGYRRVAGDRTVVNLQVQLGRLALKNPVLVASGTFGYVREMAGFVRLERLGGVIPKTVTFRPRAGNPTPRTVETASGLLNAIGLDNDGIDHFRDAPPALPPHGRHGGDRQHRRRGRGPVRGDGRDARRRAGPGGDRAQHLVPERQPRARPGDRRRRGRAAGAAGPGGLPAADHRQADAERDRHRRRSPRRRPRPGPTP